MKDDDTDNLRNEACKVEGGGDEVRLAASTQEEQCDFAWWILTNQAGCSAGVSNKKWQGVLVVQLAEAAWDGDVV